ncbi:MAG: class D sortase [Acidobacteria bacterium]|nr:class D sortase [Acidobacteriota bacterium]
MTRKALPRKQVSRRIQSFLHWCSHCFLLAGLLALGCYGFVWANARLYQAYLSWRFDQMTKDGPVSITGVIPPRTPPNLMQNEKPARDTVRPPAKSPLRSFQAGRSPSPGADSAAGTDSLIGRIGVPRIGLSAIVVEGDDKATLGVAVGHIPSTALPGQRGNVGIAGHRDTFFRRLHKIRKNDVITLSTLSGSYQYRVESIEVVEPSDTEVLKPTSQPTLTLVTCYPFSYVGSAPERFIVRARQIAAQSG